ncbi:TPA: AAA family ATPase [Klebsiella pneumoniae]|uniref:AAA family ATPase n=1 Tax=Klebsiella pneumoniae TaxID=573 RepID=UPI002E195BFA|nr:AAA family ATPase [Klebsiella pneumoniae]MEC5391934.1 AAA family ATPase [Klebsiella pneumoniae]HBS7157337.1 AAA family ATPase [Klebsiella pneumoniae]HBZ7693697.1 AAA family ATPase [Klebsiella variicola subsp. variicola]
MINIDEVSFSNIWRAKKGFKIKLDRNFTVLTGYNGCGKTTVLDLLHASLSFLHNVESALVIKDWATQINFDNNLVSRVYNFDCSYDLNEETKKYVLSAAVDNFDAPLDYTIDAVLGIVNEFKIKTAEIESDSPVVKGGVSKKEVVSHTFGLAKKVDGFTEQNKKDLPFSILFKNEEFFYNEENENAEELEKRSIFTKENNIDKTLYRLLNEFVLKEASQKDELETFAKEYVKKQISSLIKKNIKDRIKSGGKIDDKFLKGIDEIVEEVQKDVVTSRWGEPLFKELDNFFSLTKRSVFRDSDGFIGVKLKNENNIKWFNLSRGEKTLISLLLNVYLNKDKNVLFIFDEPDLSLHIEWQELLLPSLSRLAPDRKFILSTHSPALIGNVCERFYNMTSIMDI